ncbi:HAMP domain-containing sensor histidine kinase [Marinifilum sp. D714]|uniref:sensor histidine kinase n=1 Tax=Marinifilum sp. D714 TaxID=2937523 RepID=UPI0027C369E8|nr:HAMP domain-containing sensor histidine kinase [Marinifilum sp. D714]MDQ2179317.1 HAMP domain-containing histidine kinase [Marinifilum sp. D714]
MKLLSKINRTYLRYGILVFLIADVVIILMSNFILKEEIDQQLLLEAEVIAETFEKNGNFLNVYPTDIVEEIAFSKVENSSSKDTLIYDAKHDDLVPYRELSTFKSFNGKHYQIITRQMLMEFDDIFSLFTALISTVLGLIFILVLLFTQKMNTILWGTFNKNVELLKGYSFSSNNQLKLKDTGIEEFDDLNQVITKMSDRLEKDYRSSKEFSANAAHELQTPLAIIRNKCENLFSETNLNDETIQSIREIYLSTDRLSGIVKGLLLLAKIDHGQFNETEEVSFSKLLKIRIDNLDEILQDRNLSVDIYTSEDCRIKMDMRLASLLIQNITTNAVNHSPASKIIEIKISKTQFSISNHGETAIKDPELIFKRFYKESKSSKSTGIGLALVKKIADHYGMKIQYSFKNFKHTFTFKSPDC